MPTEVIEHRRRLPHQYPEGRELFLTWHLLGSVPPSRFPPPNKKFSAGEAFVWIDRYLDTTRTGPMWLKDHRVAKIVEDSIRRGAFELGQYELSAYVVMANHVHMLVLPIADPTKLLRSLKSYTARQANKLLGRSGPFWQRETYDHWLRKEGEYDRIKTYIENNPVKAGLVTKAADYRWSSASKRWT